jgi:hypothetical protein
MSISFIAHRECAGRDEIKMYEYDVFWSCTKSIQNMTKIDLAVL